MAITLLPPELLRARERPVWVKFAPVGIALYIIILLAVGGVFFWQLEEQKSLVAQRGELKSQINKLREREISFFLLKDRISSLVNLGAPKVSFRSVLGGAINAAGTSGNVQVLDVTTTQDKIILIVGARDTFEIERFLDAMVPQKPWQLETLERDASGEYSAIIVFNT